MSSQHGDNIQGETASSVNEMDTEERRCKRFRMGLSPEVRKELTTFGEADYADLVDIARSSERDSLVLVESQQVSKKGRFEGGEQKFQGRGGQSSSKSICGFSSGWKGKQRRGSELTVRSDITKASRRCYNCGAMDHLVRDCPDKKKDIRCYRCQEKGHIATHCQKKSKKSKPTVSSVGSVARGRGTSRESMAPRRVFAVTRQGAQEPPKAVADIFEHVREEEDSENNEGEDGESGNEGSGEEGQEEFDESIGGFMATIRQCYACGSEEHLARDCPEKWKNIRCYGCGEMGHMVAQCPEFQLPGDLEDGEGSATPGRVYAIVQPTVQSTSEKVAGILNYVRCEE